MLERMLDGSITYRARSPGSPRRRRTRFRRPAQWAITVASSSDLWRKPRPASSRWARRLVAVFFADSDRAREGASRPGVRCAPAHVRRAPALPPQSAPSTARMVGVLLVRLSMRAAAPRLTGCPSSATPTTPIHRVRRPRPALCAQLARDEGANADVACRDRDDVLTAISMAGVATSAAAAPASPRPHPAAPGLTPSGRGPPPVLPPDSPRRA
jgi:hypothetical protein